MADRDGQSGATARSAVLSTTASLSVAYDWRVRHRMVLGRGGRWAYYSIPVVDLAPGVVFLAFVLEPATSTLRFGDYAIHVTDFVLCLTLALAQFGWLRLLRVSFIATYALLVAYAILVILSPANLGLSPIIVTAIISLYTAARWEPDRR